MKSFFLVFLLFKKKNSDLAHKRNLKVQNKIQKEILESNYVKSVPIGVFSGPYFLAFGLNAKIYSVNLHIQSKYGKIRTRKTPYLDSFYAVSCLSVLFQDTLGLLLFMVLSCVYSACHYVFFPFQYFWFCAFAQQQVYLYFICSIFRHI